MKKSKRKYLVSSKSKYKSSRRKFIKQIGLSCLVASGYSLISLSQFACSESVSPGGEFPVPPSYYYGY